MLKVGVLSSIELYLHSIIGTLSFFVFYFKIFMNRFWYSVYFFSLSLLLVCIILPLTRHGMFMDGVIYAAISKNLSMGYGSLWKPFYSQTDFAVFYEHPPLVFYFQSLFFKLFGHAFWVERFYSFLMALGQFGLIAWYWLKNKKADYQSLGLLLLLWLLIPLNHIYDSNMLEGTLTLFTTAASLILLVETRSTAFFFIKYLLGALTVVVAFFCNGPTALFPLAVPFFHHFFSEQRAIVKGIKETALLVVLVTFILSVFYWLVPAVLQNTQQYFSTQLLASIVGTRTLTYVGLWHLHIFYLFFRSYWLATVVAFVFLLIASIVDGLSFGEQLKSCCKEKKFWLFFTLTLISSLPVGVSHRQALSYIMQSAPFFVLAMMYFCYDSVKIIALYCEKKKFFLKTLNIFSGLVFVGTLIAVLNLAGGFNRDKAMLADLQYLMHYCQNDEIISASPNVYYAWYTGAYLARYSMMSVTPKLGNKYYLALKTDTLPSDYHLVQAPLAYYNLLSHD